ncbi:MAG TPA: cytochrome c3 family protein [Myxococcota bacterium]|nr:cytochrome c3 family protein [Myxococcota bacterium]HRY95394.1 cytochrome c3 family protein [Myxococcota bacterium]HSA21507.1 cytochrome c3 family protein [Myxococcota bacterium]
MSTRTTTLALLAGLLAASGAVLAADGAAEGAPAPAARLFSHKLHLEQGAECSQCHDPAVEEPALKQAGCADCHEDALPPWRLPAEARPLSRAAFPHRPHAARVECRECHAPTLEDRQVAGEPFGAFDACQACHRERSLPLRAKECALCHGQDARRVKPASHALADFGKAHGRLALMLEDAAHGQGCKQCHRADQCAACHRTREPASHTAIWRMRTHGLAAGWDRDSCKTCHESGTCLHCHRTTKPLNHAGAWAATHGLAATAGRADGRCLACHSAGYCAACHAGR